MGAEVKRSPGATYWADWQYTEEEWQRFDQLEWRHTWRLVGQQLGLWIAMDLGICILEGFFGFSKNPSPESIATGWWVLAYLFSFILLIGLWRARKVYRFGQVLHMARRQSPRRIRISPATVMIGEIEVDLLDSHLLELRSVTLLAIQPAVLQFITLFAKRTRFARQYEIWVPVPAGHETEAAALAERFRREVIGKDRVYWGTPSHTPPPPPPRPNKAAQQAQQLHRQAGHLMDRGNYDQALTLYTAAIQLTPTDASLHWERAVAWGVKHDYPQALADATEAIRWQPDNPFCYHVRATIYQLSANYDQAIADLSQAIDLPANNPDLYYARGCAYFAQHKYNEAISDWSRAIALQPRYAAAYNNRAVAYGKIGNHKQAVADFSHALKWEPDAQTAINRGIAYIECGDYKRAIADFNWVISEDSDEATGYYYRGLVYQLKGADAQAIEDFTTALDCNPDWAAAYNERGIAYSHQGDQVHAAADFARAIELDPDQAALYTDQGSVYAGRGEYDAAITAYNQALARDPTDAVAYGGRGAAQALRGAQAQGVADLRRGRALAQEPQLQQLLDKALHKLDD